MGRRTRTTSGRRPMLLLLACLALGGCHASGNQGRPATQPAAAAASRQKQVQELVAAGSAARRSKQPDLACQKLREAVTLDPADGTAHHLLGLACYESGDLRNAAVHLDRAAALLRDRVEPCYNLGLVLEDGGRYDAAAEAYKRALHRQADCLPVLENLARTRIKLGLCDEETLRLLTTCQACEQRPEWVAWLSQQILRIRNRPASASAATAPASRPCAPAGAGRSATEPARLEASVFPLDSGTSIPAGVVQQVQPPTGSGSKDAPGSPDR